MKPFKYPTPDYLAIPASPNDLIQIEAVSSAGTLSLVCEGIAMNSQGELIPFLFPFSVSTLNTLTILRFRLGYNFLISIVVHTRTASIPDGACYVRLSLVQSETGGEFPHRKLLSQGYVSTISSIGYGSAAISGAPRDNYFVEHISIPDPAAGLPANFNCPNFSCLEIITAVFTYSTSAAASNRIGYLEYTLPSGQPIKYQMINSHTLSTTVRYNFSNCSNQTFNIANQVCFTPIPTLFLMPGSSLELFCNNAQAADQVTAASLLVKRHTIPFS